MKKQLMTGVCIMFMLFVMCGSLKAEVGIKGGLNLSWIQMHDWPEEMTVSTKMGYQVGAYYTVKIARGFTFQPEFYYSRKGANGTDRYGTNGIWRLGYLEVPLLLKLEENTKKQRPGLFIGPYVGYNLSAKQIVVGFEEENEDLIETKQIRRFDYGIVFGGSLGIDTDGGTFTLELRFNLGIANLLNKETTPIDAAIKNSSLQFMIGYGF